MTQIGFFFLHQSKVTHFALAFHESPSAWQLLSLKLLLFFLPYFFVSSLCLLELQSSNLHGGIWDATSARSVLGSYSAHVVLEVLYFFPPPPGIPTAWVNYLSAGDASKQQKKKQHQNIDPQHFASYEATNGSRGQGGCSSGRGVIEDCGLTGNLLHPKH